MKRILSIVFIGSLALGSVITFGVGSASAATTTPTVVLSGAKGMFPGSTPPLVATTSVAGAVTFNAGRNDHRRLLVGRDVNRNSFHRDMHVDSDCGRAVRVGRLIRTD